MIDPKNRLLSDDPPNILNPSFTQVRLSGPCVHETKLYKTFHIPNGGDIIKLPDGRIMTVMHRIFEFGPEEESPLTITVMLG